MSRVVLDASAVIAYLKREPGYEKVEVTLEEGAFVSTVNLAEVFSKLKVAGVDTSQLAVRLQALGLKGEVFTEADALSSGDLYPQTSSRGLSLGDRACLALTKRLGGTALTTDRAWLELGVDIAVKLIR